MPDLFTILGELLFETVAGTYYVLNSELTEKNNTRPTTTETNIRSQTYCGS